MIDKGMRVMRIVLYYEIILDILIMIRFRLFGLHLNWHLFIRLLLGVYLDLYHFFNLH